MKVPANIISENLYTIGKEFVLADYYKEYQGYYYEINNKFFIGKKFDINSLELLKVNSPEINPLLLNSGTSIYGSLSKIRPLFNKIKSLPFNPTNEDFSNGYKIRYFAKQINVNPIFIKEIDKNQFLQLQKDSFYQTLEVKYNFNITEKELNNLDKKMPGLKKYLSDYTLPTSSDESKL